MYYYYIIPHIETLPRALNAAGPAAVASNKKTITIIMCRSTYYYYIIILLLYPSCCNAVGRWRGENRRRPNRRRSEEVEEKKRRQVHCVSAGAITVVRDRWTIYILRSDVSYIYSTGIILYYITYIYIDGRTHAVT